MLFNSIHFIVFFIVVTLLYFALEHKYRWMLLLSSSCYFYMAFVPIYIFILAFTILIDYIAGLLIEQSIGRRRRMYLIISLIANLGVLAIFKYYNFLNDNLSFVLKGFALDNPLPYLSILLPIGLSFHTFQAMSYTIEVYRGKQLAERHFGIYALYVMFYPQLVAGPIERPQNLLHQFREKHEFDYARITSGLRLITWGLFKKVVIADRLAMVVDPVYGAPQNFNSLSLIIATIFFSFQIFCDFSGYSDMAIGVARVMGFKLMNNFNKPYQATSIPDFWKRWHISLSTWFKDYLYIPLGGNRVAIPRWYLNIFIVFLVSGLWHGAGWTFLLWGSLHGFYMIFGYITRGVRSNISNMLGINRFVIVDIMLTFSLVAFARIFFRSETLQKGLFISTKIFWGFPNIISNLLLGQQVVESIGGSRFIILFGFVLILILESIHWVQTKVVLSDFVLQQSFVVRWGAYLTLLLSIMFFGVFESRQFIYFQF